MLNSSAEQKLVKQEMRQEYLCKFFAVLQARIDEKLGEHTHTFEHFCVCAAQ